MRVLGCLAAGALVLQFAGAAESNATLRGTPSVNATVTTLPPTPSPLANVTAAPANVTAAVSATLPPTPAPLEPVAVVPTPAPLANASDVTSATNASSSTNATTRLATPAPTPAPVVNATSPPSPAPLETATIPPTPVPLVPASLPPTLAPVVAVSEGLTGHGLLQGIRDILRQDPNLPGDQVQYKPFMGSFSTIKSEGDAALATTGYCLTDNACGRGDAYSSTNVPLSDLSCNKFCYVDANSRKYAPSQVFSINHPPKDYLCCGWETC